MNNEIVSMTVSEIFDKCEKEFESEGDILNYLYTEPSIVLDDIEYEIDGSFENANGETTFILKTISEDVIKN